MRYVIILAIGICIGYGYGFRDAKQNDKTVVERVVDRVGGSTRDNMKTDVDRKMREVEQH
jgi:hypothetical protein